MSKTAFIFPGQGAQYVGMGKDFYDTYETARKVFELAKEATGLDVAEICFTENERLNITEYTQIAMLTTEVAILKVLEEQGFTADCCAGLSLGEYGALAAADGTEGFVQTDSQPRYFHAGGISDGRCHDGGTGAGRGNHCKGL